MDASIDEKVVLVVVSFSTKVNVLALIPCCDDSKGIASSTSKFCS